MAEYKEILLLKEMLDDADIPYDFAPLYHGYHLVYPDKNRMVYSVIEHDYSYGREQDLLEIMAIGVNDVEGFLTAEDVFERIKIHYEGDEEKSLNGGDNNG